jgi:hypothetical protein
MRKFSSKSLNLPLLVITALVCGPVFAQEPGRSASAAKPVAKGDAPTDRREAMEKGREIKANVDLWGERVRRKCQETEKVLQGLDLKKIEGQKVAKDQLLDLLDELDLEAAQILDAYSSVITDLRMYRKAVAAAPAALDAMAVEFERKAEGVQSEQLKAAYADGSAMVRKMARGYETRSKSTDGTEANMEKQIGFVRESRTFIQDVKELLDVLPTEKGLETEKWVERVNTYIESFQNVVHLIKETGTKLGEEPTTPTRVQKPAGEQAGNSTPRAPITSAADYRARVAALR